MSVDLPAGQEIVAPAAVNIPSLASYRLSNRGATMGSGEPTEGGTMTRSLWVRFAPTQNARVVIHTFGSHSIPIAQLDTVLVVYRQAAGTGWGSLVRVVGNNNVTVPGLSTLQSLVQFDATAGTEYFIQVGTVGNTEGNIVLNTIAFDPGGGLSAFPQQIGTGGGFFPVANARDYICEQSTCPSVTLVLHNSAAQPLSVTGTTTFPTNLSLRFDNPAPVALAAGGLATITFTGRANGNSTPRTETGQFVLTGRTAGAETTRASYYGILRTAACCGAPTTSIVTAVAPNGRAGIVNQIATGFAAIINTGTATALGCHLAASTSDVKVRFQATNPQTNQPIGQPNAPVDIPAGQTRTFVFSILRQSSATGDPVTSSNPLAQTCANLSFTGGPPASVANNFALTSLGTLRMSDMISIAATLSGDGIVNVPPGSQAFAVATINIGFAGDVRARAKYVRPLAETAANKQFTAVICRTNPATGACLQPPAPTVDFVAAANQSYTFATFVQRPAVDPGFDPAQRRMLVRFDYLAPDGWDDPGVRLPIPAGSTSVAVRATN